MVIVRGAVDPLTITTACAAVEDFVASGMNATQHQLWETQRGIGLDACPSRHLDSLLATVEQVCGRTIRPAKSSFRLQEPAGDRALPWHQDWGPMGGHTTGSLGGIVCWVPCDPIDGTRPTLEFADADGALPHEGGPAGFQQVSQPVTGPTTILTGLAVGDVVLFSPFTLHRTLPLGTQPRRSFDLRGYPC